MAAAKKRNERKKNCSEKLCNFFFSVECLSVMCCCNCCVKKKFSCDIPNH